MSGKAFLLDTHTFLWMRAAPHRLGAKAAETCGSAHADLVLSVVSIWEMAIKLAIGKLTLGQALPAAIADARRIHGLKVLPIEAAHAIEVQTLPFHHRDPFDRLLAVQARVERLPLLSADPVFDAYGVERIW